MDSDTLEGDCYSQEEVSTSVRSTPRGGRSHIMLEGSSHETPEDKLLSNQQHPGMPSDQLALPGDKVLSWEYLIILAQSAWAGLALREPVDDSGHIAGATQQQPVEHCGTQSAIRRRRRLTRRQLGQHHLPSEQSIREGNWILCTWEVILWGATQAISRELYLTDRLLVGELNSTIKRKPLAST